MAGLVSAFAAARDHDYRSEGYSAGSSLGIARSFVLFGKPFVGSTSLAGRGGLVQRISIGIRVWMADSSLAAGAPSLPAPAEPRQRATKRARGSTYSPALTAETERPRHALIGIMWVIENHLAASGSHNA